MFVMSYENKKYSAARNSAFLQLVGSFSLKTKLTLNVTCYFLSSQVQLWGTMSPMNLTVNKTLNRQFFENVLNDIKERHITYLKKQFYSSF